MYLLATYKLENVSRKAKTPPMIENIEILASEYMASWRFDKRKTQVFYTLLSLIRG